MLFLAHRTEDGREQSQRDHLLGTAKRAQRFAASFDGGDLAYMLGLAHDIGKYSDAFQRRILGANLRVDHATAGAQEICGVCGALAAYCVAGHHGGLPDGGGRADPADCPTLSGRLKRRVEPYGAFSSEIALSRVQAQPRRVLGAGGFTAAFWTRMLFSCLVDADFLDTEEFMAGKVPERGWTGCMDDLLAALEKYVAPWWDAKTDLNRTRCAILRACLEAGEREAPGLFALTVPTGGGKTVASLAFALQHAKAHSKQRIIYVIPYVSIVEQTADTFRDILGVEPVLEHHSNVDLDDEETGLPDSEAARKKLAAENWDLPVVVTTAVQFFESLFSSKPSRCRKLHNLADSVIIFDEAQTLPLPYLQPCVRAIAELTVNYGASCVLCTATQPALGPLFQAVSPDLILREIAPPIPAEVFRRVTYTHLGQLSDEDLAARLREQDQALCIVSTRKQAQTLYGLLEGPGVFHLSTLMTPDHRHAVLKSIRTRLNAGLPCRVIATSLIEAGVDVDFPTVYRAEAGLDSMVQAAGRCNREGKRPAKKSMVYLFQPDSAYTAHLPDSMKRPIETARLVLRDCPTLDDPETIQGYFQRLYQYSGLMLDAQNIVSDFEQGARTASFPFASAAKRFHLIDSNTHSVLIPRTDQARDLAGQLKNGQRSRALLRRAGRLSVNIYENHFQALNSRNALDILDEGVALLTNLSLYSENTGLALASDGGLGIFL